MPHSYEELRSAVFDVLAGRVSAGFAPNQYGYLKIGVRKVLEQRGLEGPLHPGNYAADAALEPDDADTFLEVFWDLFRQGIISLGASDSSPEFPFCRVTALGKRVVAGENPYFVLDVTGYAVRLKREIPQLDEVTLTYLKEAMQDFRAGCLLSATVMLGVATEHTFYLLTEVVANNTVHAAAFAPVAKEWGILKKLNRFKDILDGKAGALPAATKEDLDTHFMGIVSVIRRFRNESGHPSGVLIGREQAYVLLELFPAYCRKMYQLMDFFR